MTTEEAFQARLDAEPDNHDLRTVFADYLDEVGDPRADGYRALGFLRRRHYPTSNKYFSYGNFKAYLVAHDFSDLPNKWWWAVVSTPPPTWDEISDTGNGEVFAEWTSRKAADDAVASAYATLSESDRKEIADAHAKAQAAADGPVRELLPKSDTTGPSDEAPVWEVGRAVLRQTEADAAGGEDAPPVLRHVRGGGAGEGRKKGRTPPRKNRRADQGR